MSGKRHPLLVYFPVLGRLRAPGLLTAVFSGVLWWYAPGIPGLESDMAQGALLVVAGLGALLFLYGLVGPRLCYLQCRPTHLRISVPLYTLAISYSRIRSVRPAKFAPRHIRPYERDLLKKHLGQTAISLDLNGYPVSERWLRLWLHRFLFSDDSTGFVILSPDWMAISREVEAFRGEWKMRRAGAQKSL